MGILTNFLKLLKPEPNDFYNQQTEQAENWDKVDKFAKDVTADVAMQDNSIWGGEYGGLIQDQTTKVVGKRYVDSDDGKSYLCIKAGSNINTVEFYTECTVKGNLEKIQNLVRKSEANYVFTKKNSELLGETVIEKVGNVTVVASSFYNSVADSAITFKIPGKKCIACTASPSNGSVKLDKLGSSDGFFITPSLSNNTIHFIMYLV